MRPFPFSSPTSSHTSLHTTTFKSESYLHVAHTTGLLPPTRTFPCTTTEHTIFDSYQKRCLLLRIFHELMGAYPAHIMVIGYAFKRRCLEQFHLLALRWLRTRFMYKGVLLGSEADKCEAAAGSVRSLLSISPLF